MSDKTTELLNSLSDEEIAAYSTGVEEYITIDADRYLSVPESKKKIGIEHDHNVNTLLFKLKTDYLAGVDLGELQDGSARLYINYMLPNGELGCYLVEDFTLSDGDIPTLDDIIALQEAHIAGTATGIDTETDTETETEVPDCCTFSWTITENVTRAKGTIRFLLCVKETDTDDPEAIPVLHWNSELNCDLYVNAGLEAAETLSNYTPDFITQVLVAIEQSDYTALNQRITDFEEGYEGLVQEYNEAIDGAIDTAKEEISKEWVASEVAAQMETAKTDLTAEVATQMETAKTDLTAYIDQSTSVSIAHVDKFKTLYVSFAAVADDVLMLNSAEKADPTITVSATRTMGPSINENSTYFNLRGTVCMNEDVFKNDNSMLYRFCMLSTDDIRKLLGLSRSTYNVGSFVLESIDGMWWGARLLDIDGTAADTALALGLAPRVLYTSNTDSDYVEGGVAGITFGRGYSCGTTSINTGSWPLQTLWKMCALEPGTDSSSGNAIVYFDISGNYSISKLETAT